MAKGESGAGEIERGVAAVTAAVKAPFPKTALILGSGLGPFADKIADAVDVPYGDIPGFPVPTVHGHQGRLRVGTVSGHGIACMQGRLHAYEGHPAQALAVPIRILKRLGVERLILTNAAGGLKLSLPAGTLMIVEDHINFSGQNPLIGVNDERFGPRFFDMSQAYDSNLRRRLEDAARATGVAVSKGVYVYALGPNFETPAEIRMFAGFGADAVGMSTVPECLAAVHCGIKVAALSVITNLAAGLAADALTHHDTLSEAAKAYDRVERLLLHFFAELYE
ncbi:MAG TPA: purine-nucleoside phosphorylase [Rhizomicrobium sp.]|jgi:inosine/guanosine/xanthosine phosphorylase family protein|nr:purine-nucleoside phosphorylase [Rhizomicrobium sp.]